MCFNCLSKKAIFSKRYSSNLSYLIFIFFLLFAGCTSSISNHDVYISEKYEAKAQSSGEDYGMHEGWVNRPLIGNYNKVYINVFINKIQEEQSTWDSINVRHLVSSKREDDRYIADYTRKSFIKAFKGSRDFQVVDQIDSQTLKINFAIVQIIPNKPILGGVTNILGLTPVGLLLDPLKAGIKGASDSSGGAVAMETVITSGLFNRIVAVFADREKGEVALFFNTEEFVAYGEVREIIDRWTTQIVEVLDSIKKGKEVNPNYRSEFSFIKL